MLDTGQPRPTGLGTRATEAGPEHGYVVGYSCWVVPTSFETLQENSQCYSTEKIDNGQVPMSVDPVSYDTRFAKVKFSSRGEVLYGFTVLLLDIFTYYSSFTVTATRASLVTLNTVFTMARVLPSTPEDVDSRTISSSPRCATVLPFGTSVGTLPHNASPITSLVPAVFKVSTGQATMSFSGSAPMQPNALWEVDNGSATSTVTL